MLQCIAMHILNIIVIFLNKFYLIVHTFATTQALKTTLLWSEWVTILLFVILHAHNIVHKLLPCLFLSWLKSTNEGNQGFVPGE